MLTSLLTFTDSRCQVKDDLGRLENASSQAELTDNFRAFGRNADELVNQAARRQMELKDPQLRDNLAAARAVLKKNSMMLLTASKVRRASERDHLSYVSSDCHLFVLSAIDCLDGVLNADDLAPVSPAEHYDASSLPFAAVLSQS